MGEVSSPRTIIGVDAGGTTTRAVLADESGTCLALAVTGPGNPISAGPLIAQGNVISACEQVLTEARAAQGQEVEPAVVAVTMAGILALGGALEGTAEALAEVGITAPVVFHSDVVSAFSSATAAVDGAVLIVGTGTTGARISAGRLERVADGLGWLLGDEGSGFWLGQRVVRAVGRALDGRGPQTALVEALVSMVPSSPGFTTWRDRRLQQVMAWVYGQRPVEVARAGRLVSEVGDDPVAAAIVDEAVERLMMTLSAVREPGEPVVLGGSVLGEASRVGRQLVAAIPGPVLRARDGVAGSALIALRELSARSGGEGIVADQSVLGRLDSSIEALRAAPSGRAGSDTSS